MGCSNSKQDVGENVVKVSNTKYSFLPFTSEYLKQDDNTITAITTQNSSTAVIDMKISKSIWRCELIFHKSTVDRFIGFVDGSFEVPSFYWAGSDNHSVGFSGPNGHVYHNGKSTEGAHPFADDVKVKVEINMESQPRQAFFFVDDEQQDVHICNLPEEVYFCGSLLIPDSSFEVLSVVNVPHESQAKPTPNSTPIEWEH
ncbi:hypothetical protein BLNAU_18752 [Blattamonas nauphoetae]|uniref:SPRY domain-containing protein n=1 Tax=Blattamonas nauphoetae TaxID=2049346 RepID=A0ABQ9X5X0_9EUKA|nr:hypothetical protein BLNAU_18752 [Blattamonas nauphoetae]